MADAWTIAEAIGSIGAAAATGAAAWVAWQALGTWRAQSDLDFQRRLALSLLEKASAAQRVCERVSIHAHLFRNKEIYAAHKAEMDAERASLQQLLEESADQLISACRVADVLWPDSGLTSVAQDLVARTKVVLIAMLPKRPDGEVEPYSERRKTARVALSEFNYEELIGSVREAALERFAGRQDADPGRQ